MQAGASVSRAKPFPLQEDDCHSKEPLNSLCFVRAGLQPRRKRRKIPAALAAEGMLANSIRPSLKRISSPTPSKEICVSLVQPKT